MVVQWISVISLLIFLFYSLFAYRIGVKRGFVKSAIRLVMVIASMIISLILLKVLRGDKVFCLLDEKLWELLLKILSKVNNLDANSINTAFLSKFIIALATPLAFLILFINVNFVLYLVYKVLCIFVEKSARQNKDVQLNKRGKVVWSGPSKAGGAILSFICAILIFGMYLIPLNGYVGFVAEAKNYVDGTSTYKYVDDISEQAEQLRKKLLFKYTAKLSDKFFNKNTEILVNRDGWCFILSVKKETYGAISLYEKYKTVYENWGESDDLQGLRDFVSAYNSRPANGTSNWLVKNIVCQLITSYNLKNTRFYKSNVEEKYQEIIEKYVNAIQNSNQNTLAENIISALDVVESLLNLKNYFEKVENGTSTKEDVIQACEYIKSKNIEDVDKIAKIAIEDYFVGEANIQSYYVAVECSLNTMINAYGKASYQKEASAVNSLIKAAHTCLKNPTSYESNKPFVDDMLNNMILTTYLAKEIALLKENDSYIPLSEENYYGVRYTTDEKLQDTTLTDAQKVILNNFKDLFIIES